jgi:hypothetical protein
MIAIGVVALVLGAIVGIVVICYERDKFRNAVAKKVVDQINREDGRACGEFFVLLIRNQDGICSGSLQRSEWKIGEIELNSWRDKQVLKLERPKST